jgi:antitoxin component of MazEF toxin-antitoxin module
LVTRGFPRQSGRTVYPIDEAAMMVYIYQMPRSRAISASDEPKDTSDRSATSGRDIVKVRKVGDSLIVTLTQPVLSAVDIKEGDRLMIEPAPPNRIILSREQKPTTSTRRLELEIDILQKKYAALESEITYVAAQWNKSMPVDHYVTESDVMEVTMRQLTYQRDRIDVELAEKRLQLFDLQGN